MTETDRLALVGIAVARGVTVAEAWEIVDRIEETDLRAASLAVERAAVDVAFPI